MLSCLSWANESRQEKGRERVSWFVVVVVVVVWLRAKEASGSSSSSSVVFWRTRGKWWKLGAQIDLVNLVNLASWLLVAGGGGGGQELLSEQLASKTDGRTGG